jgi:phosphatidylinositol-3-phosphatase
MRSGTSLGLAAAVLVGCSGAAVAAGGALPRPDHIVIVVDENKSFSSIIGNREAPYINELAGRGALFAQSYALVHPSQPNYIMLFAGANLGVTDDGLPGHLPFAAPNLGAELIAAGLTFRGYSEGLPEAGFRGKKAGDYARKHNPWVNWQGAPANAIPPTCNLPFAAWPADLDRLPTVAFVIPDLQHDMHDGTIAQGDEWLRTQLDAYVRWAAAHNSLLVLTFDEDDGREGQRIPTLFVGPMVRPGRYDQRITHYEVLRTIEAFYGLAPTGAAASATPIDFCWRPFAER